MEHSIPHILFIFESIIVAFCFIILTFGGLCYCVVDENKKAEMLKTNNKTEDEMIFLWMKTFILSIFYILAVFNTETEFGYYATLIAGILCVWNILSSLVRHKASVMSLLFGCVVNIGLSIGFIYSFLHW